MLLLKPQHSILHFINILLLSKICTFWDTNHFYILTTNFQPHQIWLFRPEEPKNLNFSKSFLAHHPQPKLNLKRLKDPKLILILTMKQVYTYVWQTLPLGALILVALISVAFSSALQKCNLIKSRKNTSMGLPGDSNLFEWYLVPPDFQSRWLVGCTL